MNNTSQSSTHQQLGQVIRNYEREFPDPIIVQAGETLSASDQYSTWNDNPAWRWVWCTDVRGKSGYVPLSVIETRNQTSVARRDYSAVELTAKVGEILSIEAAESGWFWCSNQQGEHGWIPQDHLTTLP